MSLCRALRAEGCTLPLVTLATGLDPFDEVLGLELGADEFVSRPVHPRVLLARMQALARRAAAAVDRNTGELRFGDLIIDGKNRDIAFKGSRVAITSAEFELLWLLACNAGRVLKRDEVLKQLRGLDSGEDSRSVDARLYRLRKRFIGIADIANRIKTVRPYGYLFANTAW
ncbi:MAG: winged helix-turn-helix domain-containing protein [Betaproteobacteria bacterium]|nr:winged helix-turn-helix domain-containing protein [Betaproteobacteria bacterium]